MPHRLCIAHEGLSYGPWAPVHPPLPPLLWLQQQLKTLGSPSLLWLPCSILILGAGGGVWCGMAQHRKLGMRSRQHGVGVEGRHLFREQCSRGTSMWHASQGSVTPTGAGCRICGPHLLKSCIALDYNKDFLRLTVVMIFE